MARSIWSGTISFGHIDNFPHQSFTLTSAANTLKAGVAVRWGRALSMVLGQGDADTLRAALTTVDSDGRMVP